MDRSLADVDIRILPFSQRHPMWKELLAKAQAAKAAKEEAMSQKLNEEEEPIQETEQVYSIT